MISFIFFDLVKKGCPSLLFVISMSLKLSLFLKPVPIAFAKASLAANLFAK